LKINLRKDNMISLCFSGEYLEKYTRTGWKETLNMLEWVTNGKNCFGFYTVNNTYLICPKCKITARSNIMMNRIGWFWWDWRLKLDLTALFHWIISIWILF
jgi:hypothetical protein